MSYDDIPCQFGALDRLEWRVKQACESLGIPVPAREHIQEHAQLRMMEEAFGSWKDAERRLNHEAWRKRQDVEAKARVAEAEAREREIGRVIDGIGKELFGTRDLYWHDVRDAKFKERFDEAVERLFKELLEAHSASDTKPAKAESSDEKLSEAGDPGGQSGQAGP